VLTHAARDAEEKDMATSTSIPGVEARASDEQTGAFPGLETSEPLTDAQIEGIAHELLDQLSLEEKVEMMSGGHDFYAGMLHFGSAGYKRHPITRSALSRVSESRASGSRTGRAA
jgi:hypothetical protein